MGLFPGGLISLQIALCLSLSLSVHVQVHMKMPIKPKVPPKDAPRPPEPEIPPFHPSSPLMKKFPAFISINTELLPEEKEYCRLTKAFQTRDKDDFKGFDDRKTFFSSAQRSALVYGILANPSKLPDENYDDNCDEDNMSSEKDIGYVMCALHHFKIE